jgi:hypothetical protein
VAEGAQQQLAGFVVADHANRQDVHSQVGEIVDGVGAAAWDYFAVAVPQDQHGRFARDAGDFSEHELVGDQIREDGDRELGKGFDDLSQAQAAVVFTMFCHRSGSSRGATKIFSRAELPFRDSCQNGVYDGSGIFEGELELGDGEWFEVDL